MLSGYGYVGIFLIVAILLAVIIPVLPLLLSLAGIIPRHPNPEKNSTYECGIKTIGKTWVQFNFRYYHFAVLFVTLDVLTVFLYPWAVQFKELGLFGFIAVIVFFLIITVAYLHVWFKGALEWK